VLASRATRPVVFDFVDIHVSVASCYNAFMVDDNLGTPMTYGRKGNDWQVNSSERISRYKVDARFGLKSKGDGEVSMAYLETITQGADLLGSWAIRSYIEERLFLAGPPIPQGEVRFARRRAARRQAQRLMSALGLPKTPEGIPYISKADLDARIDARKEEIRQARATGRGAAGDSAPGSTGPMRQPVVETVVLDDEPQPAGVLRVSGAG
jgi:hypothetical protein